MQRKLAFEHTPGLALPLRFLLAAPWFGALAGLLLVWQGADAMSTRWAPATLAVTHLLTLGFLGMAMAGSLLQMVPVVAGVELRWARTLGAGTRSRPCSPSGSLPAWAGPAPATPATPST